MASWYMMQERWGRGGIESLQGGRNKSRGEIASPPLTVQPSNLPTFQPSNLLQLDHSPFQPAVLPLEHLLRELVGRHVFVAPQADELRPHAAAGLAAKHVGQ